MEHSLKLSLIDFIFVPYVIIAAVYFGYVRESPPPWRKQISAILFGLWGGFIIFGYFFAVRVFGLIMFILCFIIGLVFNIGFNTGQVIEWPMFLVIISLKYVVILAIEAMVAKDRGWFSGKSLNFLDSDMNRFVAVARPICHILMILGIIADLIYFISTGHRVLFGLAT